jgi:serine/threonine-protein kinase RsbW
MTPNFRAAFSGQSRNVPLARNAIAGFARICGFSPEEVTDIRIASGEALNNAVEHGQTSKSSGFSVSCSFDEDQLTIEIRDNGDGFAEEPKQGFGILLMRRLMDRVQFDHNGTCVRLTTRHKVS